MLVLTRKFDENIIIEVEGKTIKICVVDIDSNARVKLGFEAEKDVKILREEVYNKINGNKNES
jgi:carbon storage regulator CsrA